MRYVLSLAAAALVLLACRRGGPTEPSVVDVPIAGVLTVRQARLTHVPVENAAVMVTDGKTYWTNENGQVTLPAEYNGRVIEIMEHGFILPRRVHYTPGMVDHLLPDDQETPGEWLHTAFYQEDNSVLNRPREGLISIELSPELLNSRLFTDAAAIAIEHINQVQPSVDFFIAQTGVIKMELDPNDPVFSEPRFSDAWAIIEGKFENSYVVSSRVVWKYITRPNSHNVDSSELWKAIVHELGHHTGIWGHPPGGIMNYKPILSVNGFTAREREALRYLFLRPPGTKKPDDSTSRTADPHTLRIQRLGEVSTRIIGCGVAH